MPYNSNNAYEKFVITPPTVDPNKIDIQVYPGMTNYTPKFNSDPVNFYTDGTSQTLTIRFKTYNLVQANNYITLRFITGDIFMKGSCYISSEIKPYDIINPISITY